MRREWAVCLEFVMAAVAKRFVGGVLAAAEIIFSFFRDTELQWRKFRFLVGAVTEGLLLG